MKHCLHAGNSGELVYGLLQCLTSLNIIQKTASVLLYFELCWFSKMCVTSVHRVAVLYQAAEDNRILKKTDEHTCWCCPENSNHWYFLHVTFSEFVVTDVQVFEGTCKVVVSGDDADSKHDCCVGFNQLR